MSIETGQKYGDYTVDAVIGEGGMATVARGRHGTTDAVVALKILTRDRRADVPGLRDRVHREAEVLRALGGIPAVVDFVELFEDAPSGADVLVLEFVDGQTLAERYRRDRPDVRTVVEWMGLVCHAMNDIHEAGFVHRDIKPDNLLLTDDPGMPLKIIDFNSAGRASTATGQLTRVQGAFPHTPAYLAPECFDGVPPDASADVYALGMTFAELLLGRHPLLDVHDATQSTWQKAHEDTPFPDLHQADRRVPKVLQKVLQRATAKEREQRIPDAVVLWQELKQVWEALDTPPPAPRPAPAKRGPLVYVLGAVAAVSTAGWLATALLWAYTADRLSTARTDIEILEHQLERARAEMNAVPAPLPAPPPAPVTLKDLVPKSTIVGAGIDFGAYLVNKQDVLIGLGPEATDGATVVIDYTMTLADGTPVDSTDGRGPFQFVIGSQSVITGFSQGVKGMRAGGRRKLRIPPLLGYKNEAHGAIPANSWLLADVTLRSVNPG